MSDSGVTSHETTVKLTSIELPDAIFIILHRHTYTYTMTTGLYMLDYGAGNVRSLVNAVHRLGYEIEFVKDPSDILKAQVLFVLSCSQ